MKSLTFSVYWIILLYFSCRFVKSQLYRIDSDSNVCVCPDHVLMFNCTATGPGSTIWHVNDCPRNGITLLHSGYTDGLYNKQVCGIFVIEAVGNATEGRRFTSFLSVSLLNNATMVNMNTTVVVNCSHSNNGSEVLVDSITVQLLYLTGVIHMPRNIIVRQSNQSAGQLSVIWDQVFKTCPLFHYHINATEDCGICTLYARSMAMCSDFIDTSMCSVYIRAEVCGTLGPVGVGQALTFSITPSTTISSTTPTFNSSNVLAGVLSLVFIILLCIAIVCVIMMCVYLRDPKRRRMSYWVSRQPQKEVILCCGKISGPKTPSRINETTSPDADFPDVSTDLPNTDINPSGINGNTSPDTGSQDISTDPPDAGMNASSISSKPSKKKLSKKMLKNEIDELRLEYKKGIKSLEDELKKELQETAAELKEVKEKLDNTLQRLAKVENKRKQLKSSLSSANEEMKRLKDENDALKRILVDLLTKLTGCDLTLNGLNKKITEAGSQDIGKNQRIRYSQEVFQIQEQIQEMRNLIPIRMDHSPIIDNIDVNESIRQEKCAVAHNYTDAQVSSALQGEESETIIDEESESDSNDNDALIQT